VNLGFAEKIEVARIPPGRPSRTSSGTHTTGWEMQLPATINSSRFATNLELLIDATTCNN